MLILKLYLLSPLLGKSIVFGAVYRRPDGNVNSFMEEFERALSDVAASGKMCVLFGDFNINLLNNSDHSVWLYIDLLTNYGCVPCISKPTRVYKKSATIINHIWSNNHKIISGTRVLMTDVTDHFAPFIC